MRLEVTKRGISNLFDKKTIMPKITWPVKIGVITVIHQELFLRRVDAVRCQAKTANLIVVYDIDTLANSTIFIAGVRD